MKDLAIVLGIRPDVIRSSKILKLLDNQNQIEFDFIWSGQHYSENMKDIFFNQLDVPKPNFEFSVNKSNDSTIVSSTIENLFNHFENHSYKAAVFLGDTNTVMGSIAAAQHNIPVVHIEGCMRSYDWRMPEEKYRTIIDHLSDRIYAYLESYKLQGLNEGISENVIKVTGNPIVDIINENLPSCYDMLKACAKEVGSIQIQNLGTIGGNICNASPAADSIPCLLALDAKLELSSANNQRIIPIDEFILGSRKTKLEQGEILTSIIIPKEKENGSSSFRKIGARKYLVISISMVACRILISNNIIEDISISVGSCSEVAKRIFSIERQLIKKNINEDIFNQVDFSQLNEISPITDIRSTNVYRLKASQLLIKDVVKDAINKQEIAR